MACLVGINCIPELPWEPCILELLDVVDLSVDVSFLLLNQFRRVAFFKWLGFGGSHVFPRLRHVSLGGSGRLWVVFADILHVKQRASNEVSGLNCLDPCRFH